MLTPHCSAASGMVAPPSIVSTIRLRRSSEYGFAIHAGLLPVASLNQIRARMGIRFSLFGKCSKPGKSAKLHIVTWWAITMERQPDLIASVHLYPSEKGAEGTYTATHLPLPARI